MPDLISCDRHGDNAATYVCRHVGASTKDGPVDGFEHFIDEDGNWQAMCRACGDTMANLKEEEARAAFVDKTLVVICLGCFREAAAVNGIEIP